MKYLTWLPRMIWLAVWFAWELLRTNTHVMADNVTPGQWYTPGIVRLDTWCRTDVEVTILAILITLTPGTILLGTATRTDGLRVVYVHGMYAPSAEAFRTLLLDLDLRLLRAMRVDGLDETGAPPPAELWNGGQE